MKTTLKSPLTADIFERIDRDKNGNPRYVFHFTNVSVDGSDLSARYDKVIKVCKNIVHGKKYHNKKYGGGVMIQSYNIDDELIILNRYNAGVDFFKSYLDDCIANDEEFKSYKDILNDVERVYGYDHLVSYSERVRNRLRGLPLGVEYITNSIAKMMRAIGYEGDDCDLDDEYWNILAWVIIHHKTYK